jgi:hypothetical protein
MQVNLRPAALYKNPAKDLFIQGHRAVRYPVSARTPKQEGRAMKKVIVAVIVLLCCACTTLRPTEAPPAEVQRMIMHENLLQKGERARIVTADGTVHKFRIVAVNREDGRVYGKKASVPIADIVAVETEKVSIGKTALLTGGLISVWVILILLAGPAFVMAGA